MPGEDSTDPPAPSQRRRVATTACLLLSILMLCAVPTLLGATLLGATLLGATRHDTQIAAVQTTQTDHRQRLLDSGASQEALDLHHDAFERKLDALRIQRRVSFYTRAAIHFGFTLGFFLLWRALRHPSGPEAAASTGSSASHSV